MVKGRLRTLTVSTGNMKDKDPDTVSKGSRPLLRAQIAEQWPWNWSHTLTSEHTFDKLV
jgi:hypothetical protein